MEETKRRLLESAFVVMPRDASEQPQVVFTRSPRQDARRALLGEAAKACAEREGQYGQDAFTDVADAWSTYLGRDVDERDVANMMVLLKVMRNKEPGHRDNWVDIAGYAACGAQVDEEGDDDGDE